NERKFVTPELPAGMEFTYRFTAEYERNGEVVSVTKKAAVRQGSSAVLEFADLTATKPVPVRGSDAPVGKGEALAAAPVSLSKTAEPVVAPIAASPAPVPPIAAVPTGRATITV